MTVPRFSYPFTPSGGTNISLLGGQHGEAVNNSQDYVRRLHVAGAYNYPAIFLVLENGWAHKSNSPAYMSPVLPPTILLSETSSGGTQVTASVYTPEGLDAKKQQPKTTRGARKSVITRLIAMLPPWVMKVKDRRQQKLLFRCWLVSWIMMLILLPTNSLTILGQAGFFGGIASMLMPPNMPISAYKQAATLLIVTSCAGWAWGCAAIRAAYVARDQALYARTMQQLSEKYGGRMTREDLTASAYHGDFLDNRSTVIFGVFLATGTFAMGLLRAKKPKFALPAIIATVFLDVLCSDGPLFPAPQYSLVNSFVISAAYYIAAGLFVILFVFPQTLNHEWIGGAIKVLDGVKEFIALQEDVLNIEIDGSDLDPMNDNLRSQMYGKASGLSAQFLALASKTDMLHSEVSYGQLSADDLTRLELPLRNVVTRTAGLMGFLTILVSHVNTRRSDAKSGAATPASTTLSRANSLNEGDTFRLIHTRRLAAGHEFHQKLRIEDLMPILRSTTQDLRIACVDAAKAASEALTVINTQRYKRKLPCMSQRLRKVEEEEALDVARAFKNLCGAIDSYKRTHRFKLLQPFSSLIDSDNVSPLVDEHGNPPFSLRTLFLCFVFQSNLLWAADALKSLLALILEAETKRSECQLWWPTSLTRVFEFYFRDSGASRLETMWAPLDVPPAEEVGHEFFAYGYQKDPDSRPPKHLGQKIGHAVHHTRLWLCSPETLFAFKFMTISVLLWLPAVFKSSAWFAYTEKALWALFMGQLTMALYISDQVQAVKGRVLGTLQGGLIGMVAWYVGSGGNRHVNPYGLAASGGLFLIPVTFNRLFNPYPLDSMVCGVTAQLVMGYSWVNAKLDPLGNPGVGWDVAWRRVICVFIGCAGTLILMLLPPQSRRRDVRLSAAATLEDISGLYAGLLSRWLGDIEQPNLEASVCHDNHDSHAEPVTVKSDNKAAEDALDNNTSLASFERWAPVFRSRLIKVWARLRALQVQTEAAKWEGDLRGEWPFEKYSKLVAVESMMVLNLVQLAASLGALSPGWRKTLLLHTPLLNPNLVTDTLSAFSIFAMSLRTGKAISEVLPRSLVDRVYYHQSLAAQPEDDEDETENDEAPLRASVAFIRHAKVIPPQHHNVLTKEVFMSEEWAFYATGLAGAFQILSALDETRGLCVDLCGEVPLRGFEDWRREFELRQLGARV